MKHTILAAALLGLCACVPQPKAGPDLLAWAPADTQFAGVVRHVGALADLVDGLQGRFAGVPAVDRAVARIRAWRLGPVGPGARVWGPGLALDRGVALFLDEGGARLVFGADDLKAALATLAALGKALDLPLETSGDSLTFDARPLSCALRAGLAVCQTGAAPPPEAPGRPAHLASAPDAAIWGWMNGALAGPGSPFTRVEVAVGRGAGRLIDAKFVVTPQAQVPLAMLFSGTGRSVGMDQVEAGAGFLLKLGLDGPALLGQLEAMMGGPPPPVAALWGALKAAWSGDLIVTFDGGALHPVMLIGLADAAKGAELVKAIAATAPGALSVGESLRPGVRTLRITAPMPPAGLTFDLHHAVAGDVLVLGLSPADVERRVKSQVQAAPADALANKGVHGLRLSNMLASMGGMWMLELTPGDIGNQIAGVLSAAASLRGPLELRLSAIEGGVGLTLDWPGLPSTGAGSGDFLAGLRADMNGDALGAQRAFLKAAAAHPDTPLGRAALQRLGGSGGAVFVAMAGILAAVAIPAFMKYIRRSKTSEATMNIRKLFDASVSHYSEHGTFPPSVPATPARTACQGGESVKHVPRASDWDRPTWRALLFAPSEPFYYQYEYVSDGQRFTARALGDLNCDGVLSTFERVGFIDADKNVNGGAGLFKRDELE